MKLVLFFILLGLSILIGSPASALDVQPSHQFSVAVTPANCQGNATGEKGQILKVQCCKICRKGKACGNTCIARWKTCTKPPGCACDAPGRAFQGTDTPLTIH